MRLLWITTVLVVTNLVKSGPARGNDPPVIEIDRIQRKISNDAVSKETTVTLHETPTGNVAHTLLEVYNGEHEWEETFTAAEEGPTQILTFKKDLSSIIHGTSPYFLIVGKDDLTSTDADIFYAAEKIVSFPKFPGNLDVQALLHPDKPDLNTDYYLKVDGDMGTMTMGDAMYSNTGSLRYFYYSNLPNKCTPCAGKVCDVDLDPIPQTKTMKKVTESDILTSVTLSYGTTESTIEFVEKDDVATPAEALVKDDNGQVGLLCTSVDCNFNWTPASDNTLQMTFIKFTDPDTKTTNIVLHDRTVTTTMLGDDIVEGGWDILTIGNTAELAKYQLTLTPTSGGSRDVNVDCSNVEGTRCFAYFPDVKGTGECTLTVAPYTSDTELNTLDQIKSSPFTINSQRELDIKIVSNLMTSHQDLPTVNGKICFQHLTQQEGRPFSHYELLIINEEGQWIKHKTMEKDTDGGRLCFTPFTINTNDFNLTEGTKVVASQRGLDGITVLASGEAFLL